MKQPNVQILKSTKGYQLDLTTLPDEARESQILPGLAQSSLISIGRICDSVCKTSFNQNAMAVTKE